MTPQRGNLTKPALMYARLYLQSLIHLMKALYSLSGKQKLFMAGTLPIC